MSNLTKYTPPKVTDLVNLEQTTMLSKQNELAVALNQEPPAAWVQVNAMANGSKYLPIDKVEYMLTAFFLEWYVEILDRQIMANAVVVTVRLHYYNPVLDKWQQQDGIGASPIQTDKGAAATDFAKVKAAAVQMAAPAAKTYAIKDAAECIGRIFGKDLNRRDLMNYNAFGGRYDVQELPELTKDSEDFKRAKAGILAGNVTVEQLRTKFIISPEIEKALCSSK